MDKRKKILWGTGSAAEYFIKETNNVEISLVVDKNPQKIGTDFHGHIVASPSSITDWSAYFVIIGSGYYKEIKKELEEKGLSEYKDFESYKNKAIHCSDRELLMQIDDFVNEIKAFKNQKNVLVFGRLHSSIHRGGRLFLDKLAEKESDKNWYLFSEAPYRGEICFNNILVKDLPFLFQEDQYKEELQIDSLITNDNEIESVVQAMTKFNESGCEIYYRNVCYAAYHFYKEILTILHPEKVFVWNEFLEMHIIFSKVCRELSIQVIYMENGVVPGSLVFDKRGQMGESFPTVNYQQFNSIPIADTDIAAAKIVIKYVKQTGLNRYIQSQDNIIKNSGNYLLENRPTILLFGQYDRYAGFVPYNEKAKRYHSPIFNSSESCLEYVKNICKKNNWNLIYKKHPLQVSEPLENEKGFIYLTEGNVNSLIDYCDVSMTIVSTVNYISLIRETPVVMMGYTQLRGKKCTYEAFEKSEIENQIKKALEMGFTPEMKKNFIEHVARLNKSYLWDTTEKREIKIGQDIDTTEFKLIEDIMEEK